MNTTIYKHRLVARIMLEATSPLAVGSGEKDIVTDAPVVRDCNGLPYIPGTSMAGIIRHSMDPNTAQEIFGYQERDRGEGSKVIISDALLVGIGGKALDGLQELEADEFLGHFQVLPVRQRVRITEKGTAAKYGKFDEQVVYTGTRFVFEIELFSEDGNEEVMQNMLGVISSPTFRIGSGTRCGFGAMKVVCIQYRAYDLRKEDDLDAYLCKTSSLSDDFAQAQEIHPEATLLGGWTKYTLNLVPMDFFLFSSGFGDEEADMTPVRECKIMWRDGRPLFENACTLIPATSVKGAIAHRVAYWWNKLGGHFVENGDAVAPERNIATISLFGTVLDEESITPANGNVIFSDVLLEKNDTKVIPHVKLDKFTGGVMDGALFQEKSVFAKGQTLREVIYVRTDTFKDPMVKEAFERTVSDLCMGLLPLGGGTNRGNGIFTGTYEVEEN